MAVKFRIGNWFIVGVDNESDKHPSKQVDEIIEKYEDQIESKLKNWIKNDRFFDGFRNTYARVLLFVLANVWLYGGLFFTYNNGSGFWIYAAGVALSVLAQQISVRFVFNTDAREIVDEYQESRRNRAYRRAYRSITGFSAGVVLSVLFYAYVNVYFTDGYIPIVPPAFIYWNLGAYQVAVILVFLMGLFSLMPYFAWGFKGEPFRSKNEPNE